MFLSRSGPCFYSGDRSVVKGRDRLGGGFTGCSTTSKAIVSGSTCKLSAMDLEYSRCYDYARARDETFHAFIPETP